MDPDEALKTLRAAMETLRDLIETDVDDVILIEIDAVDAFEALDQWLTKGGFLPDAWKESKQ